MSLNLNKVILAGRLTADPELKQTPTGLSVTTFTLAVNRRMKSKDSENGAGSQPPAADFISVVAWRSTAEFITRYFRKGDPICVCGQIQTRTWTDQQGQKRYATEVLADEALFVGVKAAEQPSGESTEPYETIPMKDVGKNLSVEPKQISFTELGRDDDLPF